MCGVRSRQSDVLTPPGNILETEARHAGGKGEPARATPQAVNSVRSQGGAQAPPTAGSRRGDDTAGARRRHMRSAAKRKLAAGRAWAVQERGMLT